MTASPRAAILTITCPWCGGRVEGVTSTREEQRIPCPYCRTDLHVPRVGPEIRERVIERRLIERVIESPRTEPDKPTAGWFIGGFLLALASAFWVLCISFSDPPTMITTDSYEQKREEEAVCKQQCKAKCPSADGTLSQMTGHDIIDNPDKFRRVMDRDTCNIDCDLTCLGFEPIRKP